MANRIDTLQDRIYARCKKRADADASKMVNNLSGYDDFKVYATVVDGGASKRMEVTIESYHLNQALMTAISKRLYTQYVNDECKQLLETVDRLEDLTAEVDNIQRGN